MSDSEDFTVTYTEVSNRFIGLTITRLRAGPEEPEQAPPLPDLVLEPVYPEFMPLEDEVVLAEEQPLPAAASPTTDSPGYVPESDPEEDLEEDDHEDPKEDPVDYPIDGGEDGNDEDESSDDDEDDDVDIEEDEEEEEHLAPVDSTVVALPAVDHALSAEETEPFETNESAATPPPHLAYRVTARILIRDEPPTPFWYNTEVSRLLAIPTLPPSPLSLWSSPLPQIPYPPLPLILSPLPVSSPLLVSPPLPLAPLPLPVSPTYLLGYRAVMIRLRAEAPSTSHSLSPHIILSHTRADTPPSGTPPLLPIPAPTSSPSLLLPTTDHEADRPEVCLPPQKRLCFAFGPRYEVRESPSALTARLTRGFRADYGFVATIDREIRLDRERDVSYGITDTWDEMLVDMPGVPATDDTELGQEVFTGHTYTSCRINFVMSDSEDSTITYTEVSSPFEDLSNIGSPGVIVYGYDGLPMMLEDPYVEAAMLEPPPPDFVSGPIYPELMPPEDDVFLTEEQPLPTAVSSTIDSPGYISKFDPEEDPEEDDKDPEKDPADYPTDRDDDDDEEEEESSRDEGNDKEEDEDKDEEEEDEHPTLADSIPPPHSAYRVTARMSIQPQTPVPFRSEEEIPSLPLPVSLPLPMSPPPLPTSPTHPLGYRAAMIQLRAETPPLLPIPLPTTSPPLLLPSTVCRAGVSKVTLSPQKRLCIALGPRFEVGESSSAPTARPTRGFRADYGFVGTSDYGIRQDPKRERMTNFVTTVWQDTNEIYRRLDDSHDDRSLMSGHRRAHACIARLMESEASLSRKAWVQSMDASNTAHSEVRALRTTVLAQLTEIRDLRAADRRRQTHLSEALTLPRILQTQIAVL
ncbi:hypothetical protein Tco_0614758 [Tanacetum coccineum]